MGIPLLRGRNFSDADRDRGVQVAMINQTLAEQYFKGREPIGEELNLGTADKPDWWQIVGVTGDGKAFGQDQPTHADIYGPLDQLPFPLVAFTLRTETGSSLDDQVCRGSNVERRSESAGAESDSDGYAGRPDPGCSPGEFIAYLGVRSPCFGIGIDWDLRSDGERGDAAQAGDWCADGTGRAALAMCCE